MSKKYTIRLVEAVQLRLEQRAMETGQAPSTVAQNLLAECLSQRDTTENNPELLTQLDRLERMFERADYERRMMFMILLLDAGQAESVEEAMEVTRKEFGDHALTPPGV